MSTEGFSKTVLPNGLTILLQKQDRGSISFGIGVRFGAAHHPASHLLEHLVFKGTKTKTALDIRREATLWGGHQDAFVGFFSTFFITKNLASRGYEALEILCDMIAHSTFPEKEVERERNVVLSEHEARSKESETILMDRIYRTLYCNTPLERAVVDDENVLRKIKRSELLRLYRTFYVPSQLVIVGVGPIEKDQVIEVIRKYFPQEEKVVIEQPSMPQEGTVPPSGKIVIAEGGKSQVHLMAGFRVVPRTHPDFYPLRVLSMIIGESVSSRLFEVARERGGLVYNISSHFDTVRSSWKSILKADCTSHHGTLRIYSQFSPKNIGRVEGIIRGELGRLVGQPISAEELQRNKEQVIGRHRLALQGTHQYMRMLFAAEINDSTQEFHRFEDGIGAVKEEDIQRVAGEHCKPSSGVWVILKPKLHKCPEAKNGHKTTSKKKK